MIRTYLLYYKLYLLKIKNYQIQIIIESNRSYLGFSFSSYSSFEWTCHHNLHRKPSIMNFFMETWISHSFVNQAHAYFCWNWIFLHFTRIKLFIADCSVAVQFPFKDLNICGKYIKVKIFATRLSLHSPSSSFS